MSGEGGQAKEEFGRQKGCVRGRGPKRVGHKPQPSGPHRPGGGNVKVLVGHASFIGMSAFAVACMCRKGVASAFGGPGSGQGKGIPGREVCQAKPTTGSGVS